MRNRFGGIAWPFFVDPRDRPVYFQYGNFVHPDNVTNVRDVRRGVRNYRGFISYTTRTIEIEGILKPSAITQAGIRTAIQQLEAGYGFDGRDAGLYHDDGSVSAHYLSSAASISGVRVDQVEFPKDQNTGEYATDRQFRIVLSADFLNSAATLTDFREEIQVSGTGGPRNSVVETISGQPQIHQVNARTVVRARQSGFAAGLRDYPKYPAPLWPVVEEPDKRQQNKGAPKRNGNGYMEYPISWSYSFLSPTPLGGTPHFETKV